MILPKTRQGGGAAEVGEAVGSPDVVGNVAGCDRDALFPHSPSANPL